MLFRRYGLIAGLAAALALPALASTRDEVQTLFQKGIEQLRHGQEQQAQATFQQVLALDISHAAAFELWKTTDQDVWLELLSKQGQFEVAARRLMGLATLGRAEHRDDAEAIKGLLGKVVSNDVLVRRQAVQQLSNEHGEYAVPYLLSSLSNTKNDDNAVLIVQALSEMGDDVVLPLVEALGSPEAGLRRNVALALGYIGDKRSAGALSQLAAHDPNGAVQSAARMALAHMGGEIDPLQSALDMGDAYHLGAQSVLKPHQYSDVVWGWRDGKLAATKLPRAIYGDELAKKSFYRALALAPAEGRALSGLARVLASQQRKLADLEAQGADIGALKAQIDQAAMALHAIGAQALDQGVATALAQSDEGVAAALLRALGATAAMATPAMSQALGSQSGGLRSESAIAQGQIALRNHSELSGETVSALGEAAARQALRVVAIIDNREERASALASSLAKRGIHAHVFPSGAQAIGGLRRLPGVDAIFLADGLTDISASEVLSDLRDPVGPIGAPVLLISADAAAAQNWGDRVAGVIDSADDLAKVEAALAQVGNRDRKEAELLALRAAGLLSELAARGSDIGPALASLHEALNGHSDPLTLAALAALGHAGTLEQAPAILALVNDGGRSEELRVAGIDALSGILARNPGASEKAVAALAELCGSADATGAVKTAAVRALGRAQLDPQMRAALVMKLGVALGA